MKQGEDGCGDECQQGDRDLKRQHGLCLQVIFE